MLKFDVVLKNGGYVAQFSARGGTCYSLRHSETGADILRTPQSEEALFSTPFLFGNPVLFPPNRIAGGRFTFQGREYVFPVNEPETGCHLHGGLYRLPMETVHTQSGVRFVFNADEGEYLGFPHAFTLIRDYRLDEAGLKERTTVVNRSSLPMPFMLAYHTTFRLPFSVGRAERYLLRLPVGKERLRGKNYLPLMRTSEGERERLLRAGEYRPAGKSVSAFYDAHGTQNVLTAPDARLSVVYTADKKFAYRMLWSNGGDFIVIEPQTCEIDCFHLNTPPEENGLITVPPNGSETLVTSICLRRG